MVNSYTAVDIETTGINCKYDKIIEIAAIKVADGKVTDTFSKLVNPGIKLPPFITELTHINDEMLKDENVVNDVLPEFIDFCEDDCLLGHNVMFDYRFLKQNACNMGIEFNKNGIDTLKIARKILPDLPSRKLDFLSGYFGISDENHHRALNDIKVTVDLYNIFLEKYSKERPELFKEFPLVYSVKKQVPATARQKEYLKALIKHYSLEMDVDFNQLSKSDASRKIDKIISENGRILGFNS